MLIMRRRPMDPGYGGDTAFSPMKHDPANQPLVRQPILLPCSFQDVSRAWTGVLLCSSRSFERG